MSRVVEILKRIFVSNWKMKLIALLFAFVLWSFMVADTNPSMSKTFKNIPVTFTASDDLRQKGLTSTVPLSELLSTVTVEAEAKASALQYLNENMIKATVDLSSINGPGEHTLKVRATTLFDQNQSHIVSVEPDTVTITIEETATRQVPVEVQLTGDPKDWLYYGEPVLDQTSVEISGSKSNIEEVSKAVCYIDINEMESSTKESYTVSLMDSKGTVLPTNRFAGVPSVIVEMPIYPKKEVPVDTAAIKASTTGLAQGYEITNVTVDPEKISLAGKLENIELIESVSLEQIKLSNATGDVTVEGTVKLPEGVVASVPTTVQVKFSISEPEIMKTYPAKEILVRNLGSSLHNAVVSPASIDVNVYATQDAYDSNRVTSSKIRPFVDLTGLGAGVHENVPIKFENEPDLGARLEPSQATVTVTIS